MLGRAAQQGVPGGSSDTGGPQRRAWASPVAQQAKNPPAMQQTYGREDSLEKEMATGFSVLAWRIP